MKKCKIQINYEKEIKKKRKEKINIFKEKIKNIKDNENEELKEKLF